MSYKHLSGVMEPCVIRSIPDSALALGSARQSPAKSLPRLGLWLVVVNDLPCPVESEASADNAQEKTCHESDVPAQPPSQVAPRRGADKRVELLQPSPALRPLRRSRIFPRNVVINTVAPIRSG